MENFQSQDIEKLVEFMKNNAINEITLEDLNSSLHIKGNGFKFVVNDKEEINTEEIETPEIIEEKTEEVIEKKQNLVPIISNMIGLFYSKPSPNEEPFVKVGDEIKEGQTICIIETIKLMNKIPSDITGKVAEICIEDGKPVEYGQVIMYVEKN